MYQTIVVGTDGSSGAEVAVDAAIGQALASGGTVHVVRAYKTASAATMAMASEATIIATAAEADKASHEDAERTCAEVVLRAREAGLDAVAHAVAGAPADVLIQVAEDVDADLVVVGNRGMSGARRFVLGSVPNRVSHHCPTSLLIVDTGREDT